MDMTVIGDILRWFLIIFIRKRIDMKVRIMLDLRFQDRNYHSRN